MEVFSTILSWLNVGLFNFDNDFDFVVFVGLKFSSTNQPTTEPSRMASVRTSPRHILESDHTMYGCIHKDRVIIISIQYRV